MEHIITVDALSSGQRIDRAIAQALTDYSRSFIQKLIDEHAVYLNRTVVTKSSIAVKLHDIISITITPYKQPTAQTVIESNLEVTKIYEHEHFLIINKPAGLLVHSPHKKSEIITLVHWLAAFYPDICNVGPEDRPGIIHRLDKDTSGLMIIPRTHRAYMVFGSLFRSRAIHKIYHAFVQGHPKKEGFIDLSIGRNIHIPIKMAAFDTEKTAYYTKRGHKIRRAFTFYRVIEYFEHHSLVEFNPITGRTHQIRVHASAIGHPIIGDKTYGTSSPLISRHALHASAIKFQFDSQQFFFSLDLPKDMRMDMQQIQK